MPNILIIEPQVALAERYQRVLAKLGSVEVASGAQAAIESADAKTPDIVILELLLIDHSGVEFLYEFRSYAEWQSVPIIILSLLMPSQLAKYQPSLNQLGVVKILSKADTSVAALRNSVASELQKLTLTESQKF